jgi:hypothetical protein
MQSNFTNLTDIINLDEPGNNNENEETHIENFPSPKHNTMIESMGGGMSGGGMGGMGMGGGMSGGMGGGMGMSGGMGGGMGMSGGGMGGGGMGMSGGMGGMGGGGNNFSKQPNYLPSLKHNTNIPSAIMNNMNKPIRQNYMAPPRKHSMNVRRPPVRNEQQFSHLPLNTLTPEKIDDMTDKYEQLCEICNKIYHNNNQMHTMYTVVIISLFIIIMMLLKKVIK